MPDRRSRWYCPTCDMWLEWFDVTFYETHDERQGGCGQRVEARIVRTEEAGKPVTQAKK